MCDLEGISCGNSESFGVGCPSHVVTTASYWFCQVTQVSGFIEYPGDDICVGCRILSLKRRGLITISQSDYLQIISEGWDKEQGVVPKEADWCLPFIIYSYAIKSDWYDMSVMSSSISRNWTYNDYELVE